MSYLAPWLATVLILVVLPAPAKPLFGLRKAPDFALETVFDRAIVRLSDFVGRVVLINFWATWCPPCMAEIPDLVSVFEDLGPKGFEIIGISIDEQGPDGVRRFLAVHQVPYTMVMQDGRVKGRYGGIRAIPMSFLVNRKGEIVETFRGALTRQAIENAVKALL